jgi:hypothetical protein
MVKQLKISTLTIAIYLLWIAAVLDPIGNFFMLRYIALIGAMACVVLSGLYLKLFDRPPSLKVVAILYISFLMPVYGFEMYAIRGGYTSKLLDTSYAAAGLLLLTSLLYDSELLCRVGIRAMVLSLRLLVLVIVSVYAATTFGLGDEWAGFFTERNAAVVSTREFADITFPYIYFLASPMLIYLIAYDLNKLANRLSIKSVLVCAFSIFAFALSGTRAHMILALAYPPLFYIFAYARHKVVLTFLFALVVVWFVGLFDFKILDAFFATNETNNAMKLRMLTNYAEIFNDPLTFIFGQGYNAHAWSSLLREMIATEVNASKTELTYLEIVRVYGLLISIPFFLLVCILGYRLSKTSDEYRWLYPALVIYLLNSSFNPYLFSTNGMLPLALIAAIASLTGKSRSLRLTPIAKEHEPIPAGGGHAVYKLSRMPNR